MSDLLTLHQGDYGVQFGNDKAADSHIETNKNNNINNNNNVNIIGFSLISASSLHNAQ